MLYFFSSEQIEQDVVGKRQDERGIGKYYVFLCTGEHGNERNHGQEAEDCGWQGQKGAEGGTEYSSVFIPSKGFFVK